MPVFKNESNGTWYVMARYVNWKEERKEYKQFVYLNLLISGTPAGEC